MTWALTIGETDLMLGASVLSWSALTSLSVSCWKLLEVPVRVAPPASEAEPAARHDGEDVRAEARDAVLDVDGGSSADGDEHDHGGDADRDSEHGESGPHPVRGDAAQRDHDSFAPDHAVAAFCVRSAGMKPGGSPITGAERWSSRIWPSRSVISLLAADATSRSCVIMMTVRPATFSRQSTCRISAEEWVSRFPVGSSARMIAGSVTSARATATRCC